MEEFIGFLAVALIFGVLPLAGLASWVYLSTLKIRAKQRNAFYEEDLLELRRLAEENAELRSRLEKVEALLADKDSSMLDGLKEQQKDEPYITEKKEISYRDADLEF